MSLAALLTIPQVKRFLQDGDAYADLSAIAERYDVPRDREGELFDLTDAVLDGQLEVKDIPALLEEAFGLQGERAMAAAADVVGVRLLPLHIFVPGVKEQLQVWGADISSYPAREVGKESLTADQFAQRLADNLNLSFSDLLMKRLAFLLEQRVKGQKSDESLRTFFGRPLTIGGMGLSKDQIDALMNAVTELVHGVQIISEEERIEMEKKQIVATDDHRIERGDTEKNSITALEIPPSHEVAAEVPVISSPERHVEVSVAQQSLTPGIAPSVRKIVETPMSDIPDAQSKKKAEKAKKMQDEALKTAFSEAVDIALEKAHASLEEVKMSSAVFADIVGKMLRGIRDQYQTRDVLERDYKVKGAALASIMKALLEAEEVYRVATDALVKIEDMDVRLSEESATELEEQEARRVDAKFTELTKDTSKPMLATVELTVGSVVPAVGDGVQKKVTDVIAGNRLMGPVEQLGTMTLADFRRLSTNPDEAVRKMEALLLSLQKTSYEERVRGVLAWRKSPLASLSIALMTESLNSGVAIAEIAARRRSQGKETLGPAEMQALSKWNERVRF